ncbi:MAG TPA: hypothetical protein VN281_07195 [Verrucomicrobiae bacterium]|jgi:hypothetical protein|nr:hypothetical protein [Verrucomicrobiae bacterium]
MDIDSLRKMFGDEYPRVAVIYGVRIPLSFETQFTRYYNSGDPRVTSLDVSRFMDGSASMTLEQLRREWPTWTREQKHDFCRASCWLYKQADYRDMLRFIMVHGGPEEWSASAVIIATYLPSGEAFDFLRGVLRDTSVEAYPSIVQAIATTKHPEAEQTLRKYLGIVWAHPKLWIDIEGLNRIADAAVACIRELIELGASPSDFEDQVRKLSEHICAKNRESCRRWQAKYYPWLKETAA